MIINHIFLNNSISFSEKRLAFAGEKPGSTPAPVPKSTEKASKKKGNAEQSWSEIQAQGEKELEAYFKNMNANKKASKKTKAPEGKANIGKVTEINPNKNESPKRKRDSKAA